MAPSDVDNLNAKGFWKWLIRSSGDFKLVRQATWRGRKLKGGAMKESQSRLLAVASLVLAVLGGAWAAIGAWYPGGFLGLVAGVLGYVARDRAQPASTTRALATLGFVLGALVVVAAVALTVADSGE